MLYPPPRLPKFLSIKAARDLPRQGCARQPAKTDNSRSILLRQIPGSTVATYFPDGNLLARGALWVQHRRNVFHQVSANPRQLTLLFSSKKVFAYLPASLPATSNTWFYPGRNGDTIHPLPLSGMRRRVFPLPSPCLVFPLSPGLQRNNPRLVPAQWPGAGINTHERLHHLHGEKMPGLQPGVSGRGMPLPRPLMPSRSHPSAGWMDI